MNDTATMPVATLKAEIVTEFEFIPEYKTSRFGSSKEILAPYNKKYEATVGVKVGNKVYELKFHTLSNYMSSYTDSEGRYQSRDDIEYSEMAVNHYNPNPFDELEAAGIAIDYMDVLVQYQELVKEAKHRMTLHNRYKNWERIRANKQSYKTSWMHDVASILEADPNKRIKAAISETTIEVNSLKNFLDHTDHVVTVTYRGVTGWIRKEDGSFYFSGDSVYKLPEDWTKDQSMYNHKFEIADGKKRRAKRLGTLYLKFVEEVDYELNARKARAERNKTEAEQSQEKKARLSEIAGYPVIILKSEKSRRDHRGHYIGSYDVYTYFILTEQPESKYNDPKGFSIDEDIKTEYKDGKSVEIGREYSIKNLRGLSKEQFKSILDILMEGKVAFEKLVKPE